MTVYGVRRRTALPVAALLLVAVASPVGAQPPDRNANIWNGLDHQPAQGRVLRRERAAGVALSPRQRAAKDAELDRLSHKLGGGHVVPPAPDRPAEEGQAVR